MKIQNIKKIIKGQKATLTAEMRMSSGKTHQVFFAVDKKYKHFISTDANPFVPMALAICMKKNEQLEIEGNISQRLWSNLPKIMDTLESWNMGYQPIAVRVKGLVQEGSRSKKVGCFFSAGVDSFHTYLKNKKTIDHLIFVHGFDIPLQDSALYHNVEKHIRDVASQGKVKLITVKTNIRETLDQYFYWDVANEFALAGTALFLSQGLGNIYVSGGEVELNADYHFTAPELDSLFSIESMAFQHDGCEETKIAKIEYLSRSQTAMHNLRVCWVNKNGQYNCGECEKCFRNMLALYTCNSLKRCKTFPKDIDTNHLRHLRIEEDVLPYFEAILSELKRNGDKSAVRIALEEAIENNKIPSFKLRLTNNVRESIRFVDNKYNQNRLYWFLSKRDFIH